MLKFNEVTQKQWVFTKLNLNTSNVKVQPIQLKGTSTGDARVFKYI